VEELQGEVQSKVEELQTTMGEVQSKVEELLTTMGGMTHAIADMNGLLQELVRKF
jgi:methyl-accepting chemotaxis protein